MPLQVPSIWATYTVHPLAKVKSYPSIHHYKANTNFKDIEDGKNVPPQVLLVYYSMTPGCTITPPRQKRYKSV